MWAFYLVWLCPNLCLIHKKLIQVKLDLGLILEAGIKCGFFSLTHYNFQVHKLNFPDELFALNFKFWSQIKFYFFSCLIMIQYEFNSQKPLKYFIFYFIILLLWILLSQLHVKSPTCFFFIFFKKIVRLTLNF